MADNRVRNETVWISIYRGKRGKTYRVRWIDEDQKVKTQSTGKDRGAAERLKAQKIVEIEEGNSDRLPTKYLSDLHDEIGRMMAGKALASIKNTKTSLKTLQALCGNKLLKKIRKHVIMDFRAKRLEGKAAPATINKDVRQIKSSLSYAVDYGWLKTNPLMGSKALFLKAIKRPVNVIGGSVFSRIMAKCDSPTLRVLYMVGFNTGMRRTELANLRWADVDLERGKIHVRNHPEFGEYTKTREDRSIAMLPFIKSELLKMYDVAVKIVDAGNIQPKYPQVFTWPSGRKFQPDWLTRRFTKLVKDAGLSGTTMHDLRKSFTSEMLNLGADSYIVQQLGGWSNSTTMKKYYDAGRDDAHADAMDKLAKSREAVG